MWGWHHRLNGHELGQTLGDGEGQGGLVCCSPWGGKESDTTERLKYSNVGCLSAALQGAYYSHAFWETDSLRRTVKIVEGSLLHRRAQGKVSS